MPDREKVIKEVEEAFDLVHSDFIGTDDFNEKEWEQNKADALAMLKEQDERIKNRDESLEKAREEIKWLRGMLKEHEEPKQIVRKQCKTEHSDGSIDYFAEWYCPHCNSLILRGFDNPSIKFCYKCGKPVLWEGR